MSIRPAILLPRRFCFTPPGCCKPRRAPRRQTLTREGGPPDNASMSRAGASRLAAGVVAASAVAVLLVSAPAQTPQRRLPPPPPPRGPVTSAEAVEMVNAHNAWRTRAGVLSLRWAADLAAQAQNRALQLARQDCALEHGNCSPTMRARTSTARARSTGNSEAMRSTSCRRHTSSMRGAPSRPTTPLPATPVRRAASAATTPRSCGRRPKRSAAAWRSVPPSGRSGSAATARAAMSASSGDSR